MKKRMVLIILLLAVGIGTYFYLQKESTAADGGLSLSGHVDIRSVPVSFRVGGRLQELKVDEGASVKSGDRLGALDAAPYVLALRQATAQVESCRTAVQLAAHNTEDRRAALALLETGYRDEQIAQARASTEAQKVLTANAERDFARQKGLIATKATSQQAYEAAERAWMHNKALQASAEAHLLELQNGYRPEELAQARAKLAASLDSEAQAKANLQAAEVAQEQAALSLRDAVLVAPSDGIVMTRAIEPGSMVNAGAAVLVLSLRHPVWVRAYIDEIHLDRVTPGMRVAVRTDSGKEYGGTVGFISPQAEFTPKTVETADIRTTLVYRLRVIVDEPCPELNQGAPVRVIVPGNDEKVARKNPI